MADTLTPSAASPPQGSSQPDAPQSRLQSILSSKWLALALVAGLLWALHQVAPWSEWRAAFASANPLWLLVAIALVLPHELIRLLRMELLIPALRAHRAAHANIAFSTACVGQLPVGTIGGDVYRICRFEALGIEPARATAATFLIRVVGFAHTLFAAGIAGVLILDTAWPLLGPLAGALILFVVATAKHPRKIIAAIRPDTPAKPNGGLLYRTLAKVRRLLAKTLEHAKDVTRPRIAGLFAFSFAMFAAKAAILWAGYTAIGLDVSLAAAFAAICAGILMCAIPSPAGSVGLRESGIVGVLALLGVATAPATIGALLFRAAIIAGAGIGLAVTSVLPGASTTGR